MAMDDAGARRRAIATAITTELDRQARDGARDLDVEALAEAIDLALESGVPGDEGRRPDELNATNDD